MPKKKPTRQNVKQIAAFVASLADEKHTHIQQDGDRTRLYIEGREIKFAGDED